jgi:hypothetical protein
MTRLIRRQTVTGDTTGKRPRDLKPDPISWVVEAAAVFTPCVKPIGTYHNDHHEAFDQPLLQLLRKSPAQAYVDIDEDVAGAESALKGLRNTPRMGRTVISSAATLRVRVIAATRHLSLQNRACDRRAGAILCLPAKIVLEVKKHSIYFLPASQGESPFRKFRGGERPSWWRKIRGHGRGNCGKESQ